MAVRSRVFVRSVMGLAFAIATTLGCVHQAAAQSVVLSVRLQSLSKMASEIDTATTRLGLPVQLPSAGSSAVAFLTGLAGVPSGIGVDSDKVAFAYFLLPEGTDTDSAASMMQPPSMVMALPLAGDGSQFIETITNSFSDISTNGSATVLSSPTTPMPGLRSRLYVQRVNGYAVVGDEAETTAKIVERVAQKQSTESDATISATLEVQALVPMIESGVNMAKMATSGMQGAGAGDVTAAPDQAKVLSGELDLVLSLVKQIDSIGIELSSRADALEVVTHLNAVKGSTLADIESELQPVSDRFKSLIPADAYFACAGNGLQAMTKHMDAYMACMKPMLDAANSAAGANVGLASSIESEMAMWRDIYSGDFAIALLPGKGPTGIGLMEFVGIHDAAKAREAVLKKQMAINSATNGTGLSMGISIAEKARTYKNHDIMSITYSNEAVTAAADTTGAANAMMKSLNVEVTFTDDLMILTWGGSDCMDQAIDLATTGGGRMDQTAPFVTLFPKVQGEPIVLSEVRLLSLIKAATAIVPHADGASMMDQISESKSGLAAYSYVSHDRQTSVLRLSYDELAVLVTKGIEYKQSIPYGGTSGANGVGETTDDDSDEDVAPTDPKTACISNLRIIDAAKELYVMENKLKDGDPIPTDGLLKYLPGEKLPTCPLGHAYTIGVVGAHPTCDEAGHVLP